MPSEHNVETQRLELEQLIEIEEALACEAVLADQPTDVLLEMYRYYVSDQLPYGERDLSVGIRRVLTSRQVDVS